MAVRVCARLFAIVLMATLASCHRDARPSSVSGDEVPLASVSAEQLFKLGVGYARRGDTVRAEQYISSAKDRGYSESESVAWLVRVAVASARYNSALGYAEPYLRRHPGDWSLRFLIGNIHDALGDSERAKREFERVVREAPNEALPHYRLGILHADSFKHYDAAIPYFQRYLELAPTGRHAAEVRSLLQNPEGMQSLEGPTRIEYPLPEESEGAP